MVTAKEKSAGLHQDTVQLGWCCMPHFVIALCVFVSDKSEHKMLKKVFYEIESSQNSLPRSEFSSLSHAPNLNEWG